MLSIIILNSIQQQQLTCQLLYKINQVTYQTCQKQLRLQNTKINIQPTFSNKNSEVINSVFKYSEVLNSIQITTEIQTQKQQGTQSFALFSFITTKKISNCQFNVLQSDETQMNIYGLSKQISYTNTQLNRVTLNFKFNKIQQHGYSLSQQIPGGITFQNVNDISSLNDSSTKNPTSQIAMCGKISGNFIVKNSTFNQYFTSQKHCNLFSYEIQPKTQQSSSEVTILDSQFNSTIICNFGNSEASYNYAFFQVVNENVMLTFQNINGTIGGSYNYLTYDMSADNAFTRSELEVEIDKESETLLSTDVNFNNTKLTIGTYNNNISASGKAVSLLGERPVYYSTWIVSSKIVISSSSFTFLAPSISKQTVIANLLFNMTVNATSSKIAGLSLNVQGSSALTVQNCTFAGQINTTGSVYLLFESTKPKITVTNLTTQCDLSFGQDSYGLIKTVEGGIDVEGINSNISMNIIGNTIVTSSLMFDSVSKSSTVKQVQGYYGGYITNQTCSSTQCSLNLQQGDIQLVTRELQNIQITNLTKSQYNSKQFYLYQCENNYISKLNNTKAIFQDKFISQYSSYTQDHLLINLLGDIKITLNTEIQAIITTNATGEMYLGGIAGISLTTGYDVKDTKINITFKSPSNQSSSFLSDFFGVLNTTASFTNVTSAGSLSGSANVGGIIGQLTTGTATMKNITILGEYISGATYCGGVIGQVQTGATTSLDNLTMQGAKISSMSKSAGPVYGEHNGSSTLFNIHSMNLEPSYYGGNCPVGSGSTPFSYNQCPAKSNDIETTVGSFAYTSTSPYTSYHPSMTIHHVFENSEDLNNSKLLLTLTNMRGQTENRSLFGIKTSYNNVKVIIQDSPDIKFDADEYCFGLIQAIIDDTTVSVNNIMIQSEMNGNSYGRSGALCAYFSSNATVSNVTTNISKMHFWYTSSFIYNISAYTPTFSNININGTGYSSGSQCGFVYQIQPNSQNVTIQNSFITGNSDDVDMKGAIAYQVSSTINLIINNSTIKLSSVSTNSSSTYGSYCFYYMYGYEADFDNCTIITNITRSDSASALGYKTIASDMMFTDCNFTGFLATKGSYSSSSYKLGLIDYEISEGTRIISNCKVFNQVLQGQYMIGGLFGYVSSSYYSSPSIYISDTQVNVSIIFTNQQVSQYAGGFVGYINSTNATVEVTDSLYNNINGAEASCDTMQVGYDYSSSSGILCYPQMQTVNISGDPTFNYSYYNSHNYKHVQGACYYQAYGSFGDWNFTTFNVPTSSWSYSCGSSYASLFTFFPPDFTPSIARNITIQGRLTSKSSNYATIAIFHKNNPTQETTYTNIQLLNTFYQMYDSYYGDDDYYYDDNAESFNVSGIVYLLSGNNNVKFINCVSNYTVQLTQYQDSSSSASGLYFNNTLSYGYKVTVQDCSSNIQVNGTYSYQTDVYNISYNPGNYTQI